MAGEKKSSELSSRLIVKRGSKLLSKSTKSTSSAISSPPKAALATSNGKKDEVHRHRIPVNDMLRRRSGDAAERSRDASPSAQHARHKHDAQDQIAKTRSDDRATQRIAELEAALTIAKQEQEQLRNKLQMMRASGRENIEVHSSRSSDHDQSDEFHAARSIQEDDLVQQNYDLRVKVAKLQDHLKSQELAHRDSASQAQRREAEWNRLHARLHETEKESQERLQQLLSLKSSISTLTRSDAQATDSELVELFTQLANRVRDWILSNYRRSKLVVSEQSSEVVSTLKSITPSWMSIRNAERLAFFQAVVSSALVEILSESISICIPRTGSLGSIRQFAKAVRGTVATTDYHEWERATARMIESSNAPHKFTDTKHDALHSIAQKIEHTLFTLTSVDLSSGARAALVNILNATAELQRTLLLQKARYSIILFRNQEVTHMEFDERTMESIDDDTLDVDVTPTFAFCVFPCLQKHGDEQGETDVSNILMKARVCCGVG